jgi:hypothetical protein
LGSASIRQHIHCGGLTRRPRSPPVQVVHRLGGWLRPPWTPQLKTRDVAHGQDEVRSASYPPQQPPAPPAAHLEALTDAGEHGTAVKPDQPRSSRMTLHQGPEVVRAWTIAHSDGFRPPSQHGHHG